MADTNITVQIGDRSSGRFSRDEGDVAIVTFVDNISRARVIKIGTAPPYVTFDGSPATIDGTHTFELPAGDYVREEDTTNTPTGDVVSIIAAGPVSIRVESA